jgi:hypothetical protein
MKPAQYQENLGLIQTTLEQWLTFKKYLMHAYNNEDVLPEHESSFLEIKSNLARSSRALNEKLKEMGRMDLGEKVLKELLSKCVSVQTISTLPPPDKRQLVKDWHKVFIKMSRAIGALKMLSEGYTPEEATKKKKKGKMDIKSMAVPAGIVAVILIVLGVAYFMGLIG